VTVYIALLRAVNVGGTGKLSMEGLRSLCREAGFARIETYIASGNVVFESSITAARVKLDLEARLRAHFGKPLGVALRTAAEMRSVLKANPFPKAAPNRTVAIFLDKRPPADALDHAVGRTDEEMRLGAREIFVHYPSGQARTKLRIPAARDGTARNMNTVARLVEMTAR
jgi:uncharacterized protein (DUF1697 family)